jgi:hypothetical protein
VPAGNLFECRRSFKVAHLNRDTESSLKFSVRETYGEKSSN